MAFSPRISVAQINFNVTRSSEFFFTNGNQTITPSENIIITNDIVNSNLTATFSTDINTFNPNYFHKDVDYLGDNGKITFFGYANGAFGSSNEGLATTPVFSKVTTGGDLPGKSYLFGSSSLALPTNQSSLKLQTGDFTVEGWFYQPTTGSYPFVLFFGNSPGNPGTIAFVHHFNGPAVVYTAAGIIGQTASTALNQWNHIAWVRQSGTLRTYVNGTLGSTIALTDNFNDTTRAEVGSWANVFAFPGYISNLRVVKGTAVYTSNFTPSTKSLKNISGTVLLTCQSDTFKDNSNSNFTLTKSGEVSISDFNPFGAAVAPITAGGTESYTKFDKPMISVKNNLGITVDKSSTLQLVSSQPTSLLIDVIDLSSIGYFNTSNSDSFDEITKENDPRLLYVVDATGLATTRLRPTGPVQIWF